MRTRTTSAVLVAVVAFALADCSSGSSDSKAPDSPGGAVSQAAAARVIDAKAITEQLRAAVPTVTLTVAYTAATDPNGRLGRPHQYASKTAFADSHIPKAKAKDDADGRSDAISYGGTVEVFAEEADAKAWISYVDRATQAFGGLMAPDYLLRNGRYVIRVSHLLTPEQVAPYKAALGKLG
jgi:hypothetical protein